MRGLQTPVRAIRRQVFTEVAKLGFKSKCRDIGSRYGKNSI